MTVPVYASDISLPFRFDEECDLYRDQNEDLIEQSIDIITFTPNGSIPLFVLLGSSVELAVFDPLDRATELSIDTSIRTAIEQLEPRATFDQSFIFDATADESKYLVIIPYRVVVTGIAKEARLVISRPVVG